MTEKDPDYGITVSEISPMDQSINWRSESTAAFIGRTLRGPLDTPVLVESFAAYSRRFGGHWRRGGLSDAVEQFFLHGGKRLYVVRVANSARGATLNLPGPAGPLQLRATEPGSTEALRATVDFDGIDGEEHFNLTVQRLSPDTRLVIDQEIFSGVACDENAATFVPRALAGSSLVEMREAPPACRPYATMGRAAESRAPYVLPAERGTDGGELSDYDLIGSAVRGTGLHSLDDVEEIDLVYLPPLAPQRDAGPAALLAAELYCRRRGAMLVMDPAPAWQDARQAARGVENAGLASSHVLSYFPRLATAKGARPVGAAIAGLLCKLDAREGPWGNIAAPGYAFCRGQRPQFDLSAADRQLLVRAGLNVISTGSDGRQQLEGGTTLARNGQADILDTSLTMKRFSLKIARTIERATRWAVFEKDRALAAAGVEQQIEELLHVLAQRGAISAASVRCEVQDDTRPQGSDRGLAVMLALQCRGDAQPLSITLYQTAAGCRIASTVFAPVELPKQAGSNAA